MMTVEAQLKCECGNRDVVVTWTDAVTVGETTEVKMECDGCGSRERVVTVVYDPDLYDLKDPYGDGDFTLKAECRECESDYYGVMRKPCYECGSTDFRRFVEIEECGEGDQE